MTQAQPRPPLPSRQIFCVCAIDPLVSPGTTPVFQPRLYFRLAAAAMTAAPAAVDHGFNPQWDFLIASSMSPLRRCSTIFARIRLGRRSNLPAVLRLFWWRLFHLAESPHSRLLHFFHPCLDPPPLVRPTLCLSVTGDLIAGAVLEFRTSTPPTGCCSHADLVRRQRARLACTAIITACVLASARATTVLTGVDCSGVFSYSSSFCPLGYPVAWWQASNSNHLQPYRPSGSETYPASSTSAF